MTPPVSHDAPVGGLFADLRSHWHGRLGGAAVSVARHRGGVLAIGVAGDTLPPTPRPGHDPASLLRFAVRVRLTRDGDVVTLRQENDPAPKVHFLEEGSVRLGMRVAFDLLDDNGHYHGDGRQDLWLYPEGDVHVSWAVQTVDPLAHGAVDAVWVEVLGAARYGQVALGETTVDAAEPTRVPFDALASRRILLQGDDVPAAALYWARDAGACIREMSYDHGDTPPFYASRWPTGMQQWARGNMGWASDPTAAVTARRDADGPRLQLAWREQASDDGDVTLAASLAVSLADNIADLEGRIDALQQPLTPTVAGGSYRCFCDEDGVYEIGQADPGAVRVTFPADPRQRRVRLRHYRRKTDLRHRGAVIARVDGEPTAAQLISEGELTDDICVVMDMSHRNDSVDDVILGATLKTEAPTTIEIERTPGIQATYQSEMTGVDLQRRAGNRRDLAIWTSRNRHAPMAEVDLFSGALHRWTNHGQTDPVLWEMPMAWFLSCGISRHHYCNCNDTFEILENGPERLQLYFSGTNPNRRARSHTWLTIPGDHPRPRLEVRMKLDVIEGWDGANVEFSDIFPYPSRLPETWFHDAVLFLFGDDGAHLVYTQRPSKSSQRPASGDAGPDLFYGLFASDRGNILTWMHNEQHDTVPFHHSVCGNYIDVHVNLHPPQVPVPAGTLFDVRYETELYGDADTSVDEVRAIGRRSLAAGGLQI